jgi:hypothetical protein
MYFSIDLFSRQAGLDQSKAKTVLKANLRRNHWNNAMLRISECSRILFTI